ncbi:MAG TPA: FecR family protein [Pseudomonadales bacterium]
MKRNNRSQQSAHRLAVRVLAACATGLLPLFVPVAHASLPGKTIGEVTLVIGKAWIEKANGARERIAVGTQVDVLDRIDTASNAHVHIRFMDDGLYSVRPHSSLEIQRYDYDPANPANSAVKLNLIEGVNRSISGEAAHNARQNYRMNTPVAAIGVRGTDFTVIASRNDVEARINEGAIVVAPFSNECLADALGPCNANGLELAFGQAQVLQIANAGSPVLLPTGSSGLPESIVGQSLTEPQVASQGDARTNEELPESVTTLAVNSKIAVTLASNPAPVAPPIDTTPTSPPPPPPPPPPVPEFTPVAAVASQTLKNNQLLWGRFYVTDMANERITVDLATAVDGRKAGPGNGQYGLYRMDNAQRMQPGLGLLGFALNSAQATYKADGITELLDVSGGMLSIDFDANTFATSLNMRSDTIGAVDFNANGRVDDSSGIFRMINSTQEMAGSVSFDGKEAGYYFQKTLDTGVVDGLTLWGRQP